MKTTMKTLLCALLLFALIGGTFTGCALTQAEKLNRMEERERAFALMELIDQNGEAADSYTFDMTMKLKGEFQGVDLEVNSEGKSLFSGLKGENPAYHTTTKTETDAMGGEISSTVKIEEGYQFGKMYRYYRGDGTKQMLWSPIEWADYEAYQESKSASPDLDIMPEDCGTVTCVQEEDGSWTATMKDFTENGLKAFEELIKGFEETFADEFAIKDVQLTVKANEAFYLTNFVFDFVMEALDEDFDGDLPEFVVELEVGKYNATEINPMSFKDYTEVADLRLLNLPDEAISDLMDAKEGGFLLTIDQTVKYAGQKQELKETDKVSFTNKDGKFTYRIESEQNSYDFLMTYADGVSKAVVTEGNKVISDEEEEMTDSDARAAIEFLLEQMSYDANQITDIELKKNETDVYVLHMDPMGNALLRSVMDSVGSDELGNTKKVNYTITVKDGKLEKIEFFIDANIVVEDSMLNFDLLMVYDFTAKFSTK